MFENLRRKFRSHKFENLRRKFRSHKFDLENPLKVTMGKATFEGFRCSVCGKTLWLDLWQMNDLPPSMSRGCPGKFNPDEPKTPITVEPGPIEDDPCDVYVAGVSRPNQDRRKAPCKCGHRLEVNEHFCPICGTAAH